MVRFDDHIVVKRNEGAVFDPFASDDAQTGQPAITERTIYDGDCKVRITSGYNLSDKLQKANYTISLPVPGCELPEMICERDKAYVTMSGYTEPIECTVIEFKTYERNCIMYAMYAKKGDIDED